MALYVPREYATPLPFTYVNSPLLLREYLLVEFRNRRDVYLN